MFYIKEPLNWQRDRKYGVLEISKQVKYRSRLNALFKPNLKAKELKPKKLIPGSVYSNPLMSLKGDFPK